MGYVEPAAAAATEVTVLSAEFDTSATGITTDRSFYDPHRSRARG